MKVYKNAVIATLGVMTVVFLAMWLMERKKRMEAEKGDGVLIGTTTTPKGDAVITAQTLTKPAVMQ